MCKEDGSRRSSFFQTKSLSLWGLRLWRKLRKRLHRHSRQFVIKDSREYAWGLLFKLGSRTRAAFETSKLLRSNKTADEEVYALIKLSRNIENPHRGRVQGLLKGVVKFRKTMHWPRTSRPLGVLPLSSNRFMLECEQWLNKLILQYKYLFPSFHVPRNSLREAPHQSIKKFLHNFQVWEETMWDPDFQLESAPCPCAKYRNKLPESCFSSGHVAAGLEHFRLLLPDCNNTLSAVLLAPSSQVGIIGWPSPELCLISGSSDTGYQAPCILCLRNFAKRSSNSMLLHWNTAPG